MFTDTVTQSHNVTESAANCGRMAVALALFLFQTETKEFFVPKFPARINFSAFGIDFKCAAGKFYSRVKGEFFLQKLHT